ncbi:MAG: hypothetical protein FJ125_08290, partial [Deltaproteobacteria bacterium]|nr:hypothetical protein [Deltaproteobacteria bacterium]
AAATQEAEQKLAALRLAEQQEEARLQAAGKSRQREEARAAAAADLRQQEEARTAAAGEVRRQEEARAAAAAEARRKEEALLKATAEAGKRQAEASAASKARLERSTAKSRRQEEAAKATLAAALARVAALQAELEQKKDEARQSAARVEELKAQEVGLAATMARMRQEAEAGDAKERATVQTRQELVRAKEETAAALKQARQASRQVVELKKQAEAALSKAEETRAELSRARELASRVETAEAEARAARADLEQVTRALGEARQTTSQTQQELQQARRGGEQERQRAERLGQELASLRRQMEAHRSEAQPRQPSAGEVLALQEEMARLKREAQSATMAVAEAKKLSAMASEENERARQLRQGSPASRGRSPDEMAELTRRAALAAATAAGATAAPTAAAATATSAGAPAPARPAPPPPTMQIGDIRFEDGADRSTVIVEHRGQADYMVQEVANGSVVLHLARARLPRALERTLDTTELPTSVRAVSSFAGDPRSGDAWVVVTLDEPVESHVRKEEGRLRWEFLKTGAPAEGGTVRGKGSAAAAPRRGERAVRYPPQRVAGYSAAGSAGYGRQVEAGRERFTGKRITLDLRDADIHNVLRLLAKEGRINIIASEEVAGTITMHLERIPWDQALDVLLKTKGLTQSKEGEIIWITPLATLREQQKMEMEVKKVKQELDPLEVRLVTVNYADVASLSQQAATLLSSRGATSVDPRTKTMIIKDVPDHAEAVEDLARRLDTQTPLVLIEGRIVEADSSLRKDFGIQWGGDYLMSPASGNPTGLRFPSVVGVSGGADDMQVSTEGLPVNPNFVVNLPAAAGGGAGGALGFTFGSLGGAANLNVRLSAMEDQGSLKIVSSPKVSTLDNSTATISQGVSIPIAVISAQGVNTVFFDANLQLQVTPHVTQDGHVLLDIKIS